MYFYLSFLSSLSVYVRSERKKIIHLVAMASVIYRLFVKPDNYKPILL